MRKKRTLLKENEKGPANYQTVDSHRKNLMQKFEVNKTVNLLQKAKEFGILQ
ncbi:hypothetical protein [Chryseobacterium taklimakanense]|uniref:hypothetical protein n=1 Tax=Chryseobacterium taklimakanense TaxID=536441 RepID=UPI0013DDCFAC|nr:hypothetical protein [Chryseobacterium taklimakanense]